MKNSDLDEDYEVGKLLSFRDLTNEQLDLFIKLVSDECSSVFQILSNVLDDNYLFLELIDIFAGRRIQFPTRKKMYKLLEKIYIYTFVKKQSNKNSACKLLAKQYKKRISQINSVVNRLDYLTSEGKFQDVDNIN